MASEARTKFIKCEVRSMTVMKMMSYTEDHSVVWHGRVHSDEKDVLSRHGRLISSEARRHGCGRNDL